MFTANGHFTADACDGHLIADACDGHLIADAQYGHLIADTQDAHLTADAHDGHFIADSHDGHVAADAHDAHLTADASDSHFAADLQDTQLRIWRRVAAWQYACFRYLRRRVFLPACVGCGNPRNALCVECLPAVSQRRILPVLAMHQPTAVLGPYRRAYAGAIGEFKQGRRDVGDMLIETMALRLAPLLSDNVREAASAGDLALIGVPTTAARRRARGFDGGEFLAHGIGAAWGLPAYRHLRRLAGDTQRGKSRKERLAAHNRFAVTGPPVREQCVLLIDDVVTTGATLRDIARLLRENGLHVLGALAAAYVP